MEYETAMKKSSSLDSVRGLRVGVAYYPEQWGENRLQTDIALMREAGIRIVRMAEFAWCRMEPSEGVFDFDWLERAVNAFGEAGIAVVLGTPTATPPAWLHQKHDIYPRDEWRRPLGFGTRLQRCLNHPMFRRHSRIITEAMAKHFSNNPFVEAWQTDNELTQNYCYCDHCAKGFREWLKRKYETLETLNKSWGTVFWSQEYTDWDQIPLPWVVKCGLAHNPSLQLDYRRFQSDSTIEFQREQVEILRALCPNQRITHNIMGLNDSMDYFGLAADWDFAAWDNYPITPWGINGMRTPLGHDFTRGMKHQSFWVMEEQAGITGWDVMGPQTEPGQVRAWAWQAVSHGAKAVLFFRWRSCLYGTEQYWHGILNHDGVPRRHYREIQKLAHEFAQLEQLLGEAHVNAEVAIVHSADQHYAYHIQPQARGLALWDQMLRFYTPLWKMGVDLDVVSPDADFSRYKVVILPGWYVLNEDFADKVRRYVESGGVVVLNPRTGVKNRCNVCVEIPLPGLLRQVSGVTVEEYNPLGETTWKVTFGNGDNATVSVWADYLKLDTATPFAWYHESMYADTPAVARNAYGKGTAWYCGTFGDDTFYKMLLTTILNEARVPYYPELPEDISLRTLCVNEKRYLVLINLSGKDKSVTLPDACKAILGTSNGRVVQLSPFDVQILTEP